MFISSKYLRYFLVFLSVAFFLISCNDKDERNMVSKEKMIDVIVDIHLLEALVPESKIYDRDTAQAIFSASRKKIFKKHKVDSLTFYSTYGYYIDNLDTFEEVYTIVVDSLNSKSSTLDIGRKIDSTKVAVDSLQKELHTEKDSLYTDTTKKKLDLKKKVKLGEKLDLQKKKDSQTKKE